MRSLHCICTKKRPLYLAYSDGICLDCTNTDNMARTKNCGPLIQSAVSRGLAGTVQLDPAYQTVQPEVLDHNVSQDFEFPAYDEGNGDLFPTEPTKEEVPVASVERGVFQESAEMQRQQDIIDLESVNESDDDESDDEDTIQVHCATFRYMSQSTAASR